MAKRKLLFGGPNLPEGRRSWYEVADPTAADGVRMIQAPHGHMVDVEIPLPPNDADYFVQAGMATVVDSAIEDPAQPSE